MDAAIETLAMEHSVQQQAVAQLEEQQAAAEEQLASLQAVITQQNTVEAQLHAVQAAQKEAELAHASRLRELEAAHAAEMQRLREELEAPRGLDRFLDGFFKNLKLDCGLGRPGERVAPEKR